jgi:hypothetical protein
MKKWIFCIKSKTLYRFILFLFGSMFLLVGCRVKDYILPADQNSNVTNEKEPSSVNTEAKMDGLRAYVDPDNSLEVIIDGKMKDRITVQDSLNLITSVEKLIWIDKNRLVIISHINPSLQCFQIYHLDTKKLDTEKYGIDFTWKNNDIKTLIYIIPKPHFSSDGDPERIMNYQDDTLYTAPKGIALTNLSWEKNNRIKFELTDKNGKVKEKTIKVKIE